MAGIVNAGYGAYRMVVGLGILVLGSASGPLSPAMFMAGAYYLTTGTMRVIKAPRQFFRGLRARACSVTDEILSFLNGTVPLGNAVSKRLDGLP